MSGAPRLGERSYSGRYEQERVDDPKVLETVFGAGFAKEVFGDSEPSCRLRRREGRLVVDVLRWHKTGTADHRLTKILVRLDSACNSGDEDSAPGSIPALICGFRGALLTTG